MEAIACRNGNIIVPLTNTQLSRRTPLVTAWLYLHHQVGILTTPPKIPCGCGTIDLYKTIDPSNPMFPGEQKHPGGRPSHWNSTPTELIRIPQQFKDHILAFARHLDSGLSPSSFVQYLHDIEPSALLEQITSFVQNSEGENKMFTGKKPSAEDFFAPLVETYNQNKPDTWAACNKLNKTRVAALRALYVEWGDQTIEAMTDALNFIKNDAWWRDKCSSRTIDTLLRRGKITQLRDSFLSSKNTSSSARDRIRNALKNL